MAKRHRINGHTTKEHMITILDGYTDEPACLGVPPYVAPVPRYIYGAVRSSDKTNKTGKSWKMNYLTIDEYRQGLRGSEPDSEVLLNKIKGLHSSVILMVIASAVVPGKYLRATPISVREATTIAENFSGVKFIGGALTRQGFRGEQRTIDQLKNTYDHVCTRDLDAAVFEYLSEKSLSHRCRTQAELREWSGLGAELVVQHPDFPNTLMVELEGGRGCVRYFTGGCSFCMEPSFGEPEFRAVEDIVSEVSALYNLGVRHFRLGALSCIFSFHAKNIGSTETPTPNTGIVEKLLKGIRNAAPNLKVLHLDNANPAVMAANILETKTILKTIVEQCTGGNVLSFGLESADHNVIKANNLNTTPDEVLEMIKLVNQYGSGASRTGMPVLLPGLNFISGLRGESKETYKLNMEFLQDIWAKGLLLRRINVRQVLGSENTTGSTGKGFNTRKYHREFVKFKRSIRTLIERPMLERMLPRGTVLEGVVPEVYKGSITFGRQLGTYPLLVGIPYTIPRFQKSNIVVSDYGFRSITGFTSPFKINLASENALRGLPGIGAKRARRILLKRPFSSTCEFMDAMDNDAILQDIEKHISYDIS